MTIIERSALVPHSQKQMFELVNNIEEYPRFLQWCHSSQIISQHETEIVATLEIAWSGVHKSFTTQNTLTPCSRIEMNLVKGPFKQMQGVWDFIALGEEGCKVCLHLDFEFTGSLMDRMFHSIFNQVANSLVEAFCKRAAEIYGSR